MNYTPNVRKSAQTFVNDWCFIAPDSVVCLAKIRFLGGNIEFVCI